MRSPSVRKQMPLDKGLSVLHHSVHISGECLPKSILFARCVTDGCEGKVRISKRADHTAEQTKRHPRHPTETRTARGNADLCSMRMASSSEDGIIERNR